ncbi:MAG: hypothetical protein AB7V32_04135 [Candidatus Berkiella sp.]
MKSTLRMLNDDEVLSVSGGHVASTGIVMTCFFLAHSIMGVIELTNWIGKRVANGCDNIDEDEYFDKGICAAYQYSTSSLSSLYHAIVG